jgi:coenzyme F420 biosynthesis associated uncharacterized protein
MGLTLYRGLVVDWTIARQIARLAAGSGEHAGLEDQLRRLSLQLEPAVAGYTRLAAAQPAPTAQSVGRREWAEANLDALAALLDPLARRVEGGLAAGGPLTEPVRAAARLALAAEVGLVIGYMSQRVLGQYELSLVQPELPPRLLFVEPNLVRAAEEMKVDRDSFLAWVVLHELTHVFEFSGVPWLRGHLSALVREYLATVEVRLAKGAASGLTKLLDPQALLGRFREGGLAALVQTREQRELFDRIQAVMAVVEGYSEHVMDVVGERVVPQYDGLREAMERRRANRSAPELILQRLLGFQAKLRQYELGKSFCDAVVAEEGVTALNHVWASPQALPTRAELDDPAAWLERLRAEGVAPQRALSPGAPTGS